MPQGVNQAIIAIWVSIGLSVIAALINSWIGVISTSEFAGTIVLYSLFCLFPYKLARKSNPARWVYTILFAISMLFLLGGVGVAMSKADWIVSIISIPIGIFVIVRLFQPEASEWFNAS